IYFITKRQTKFTIISFACLGLATYMAGTVIFIFSIILGLFFFSNMSYRTKLLSVTLVTCFLGMFLYVSPANYDYAMGYIERILRNGDITPYKIKSFVQTYNFIFSSVKDFLIGSGGGNFSSRVAFITSGDYVSWFPERLRYISTDFLHNHFGIWV